MDAVLSWRSGVCYTSKLTQVPGSATSQVCDHQQVVSFFFNPLPPAPRQFTNACVISLVLDPGNQRGIRQVPAKGELSV